MTHCCPLDAQVSVPNDLGADGLLEALIDADVDADVAEAPATAAEGGSDGCTLEVGVPLLLGDWARETDSFRRR